MGKFDSFAKLRLLSATALVGGATLFSSSAMAACSNNTPPNFSSVTCTGVDTIGINRPIGTVIDVTLAPGASINTVGTEGIWLSANNTLTMESGSSITTTGANALQFGNANIEIKDGASVSGNIYFYNPIMSTIYLHGTIDTLNSDIGALAINLYDHSSFNSLSAGISATDRINLLGTTTNIFNTDNATGFEQFYKQDTGTWTLTGSTVHNWNLTDGELDGTTANLGDIAISNGGVLVFDQPTSGNYTHNITGSTTGEVIVRGGGAVRFSGNNTYTGNTHVYGLGSTLQIDNDARLGNAANNIILENGGSLELLNSFNIARNIDLASSGGTILAPSITTTLSGTISGTGELTIDANGSANSVTLTGTNTYQAGTKIMNGANLSISDDANLGAAGAEIRFSDGTLTLLGDITSTRDLRLIGNGTIDTGVDDMSTSGNLFQTGLLTVTGTGTLTLTGFDFHTGGYHLASGSLIGNSDSLNGDIQNEGVLEFNQTTDGTYTGVISDTGALIKTGTGTLILTADNTYTGGTQIVFGKVVINGDQRNGDVYLNANGALGGNGHIHDLNAQGIVAPGNSIDTLTVHGNAIFDTGSTYYVEIDDALNTDLLSVIGSTTINTGSSLYVDAASGTYTAGSLYTILTSAGGVSGTFDTFNTNLAFLTPNLIYNANNIQLQLIGNGNSFNSVAKNHVQQRIANIVEGLGAGNSLYDAFSGLTVADAQAALDDLSNANTSGLGGAIETMTTGMHTALTNRLQTLAYQFDSKNMGALVMGSNTMHTPNTPQAQIAPSAGDTDPNYLYRNGQSRIWSEAFGTDGKSNARGTAARQDRGSYGMLVGIDKMVGTDTYIGIFGGYETGEINTYSQAASTELNNYHLGAYATHMMDNGFKLNAGLGGTYHDIHTQRYVTFGGLSEAPEGDTNGFTTIGFIEGSHPLIIQNIAMEPFVGVNMTYSHIDGYTEENGGVMNLTVHDSNTITPSHTIGVRAGHPIQLDNGDVIQLGGMLGWQHAYGNLNDATTMSFGGSAGSFNSYGPGRTRDTALIGLGLNADLGKNLALYGHYNGQLANESQDHVFSGGVRYKF